MFTKSFRVQLSYLFRQRILQFTMVFLLLMVGASYINNVLQFRGSDVVEMYHPMKLLFLSMNRGNYNAEWILYFILLYPLLVAFPTGTILARERQLGMSSMIEARIGTINYIFGKVLASFAATAIVFSVPFLLEVVLNCLAFPLNAAGDFFNFNLYDQEYLKIVDNYLFPGIYRTSPYLYAVIHILVFGIFSGIMGAFITAFSSVVRFRYRFLYLFPPFLILGGMEYFRKWIPGHGYKYAWFNYLFLFCEYEKDVLVFAAVIAVLIGTTFFLAYIGSRRDCL